MSKQIELADEQARAIWDAAVARLPARETLKARWTRLRIYVQRYWECRSESLTVEAIAWYGSIVCLLPPDQCFRVAREFDYPHRHRVPPACARILRQCAQRDLAVTGSAVSQ